MCCERACVPGVCLVEKESGYRTDAVGKLNGDGSWDHGLFQVNDRYWCTRDGPPGKECNVSCAGNHPVLF